VLVGPERVVVAVHVPRLVREEAPAEAAEAATAEPEVVGEKARLDKKEKEETGKD
jgi:hypothetical protein